MSRHISCHIVVMLFQKTAMTIMIKKTKKKANIIFKKLSSAENYWCFYPSSCHPYHFNKGKFCSATSSLNRIGSNSVSNDTRCNDLEIWLLERCYKGNVVQKKVLKDRVICREDLLNREKTLQEKAHIIFNLTYHPALKISGKSSKNYTF